MCFAVLCSGISLHAQTPFPSEFRAYAGTWGLEGGGSDNISQAIEKLVAKMNFITRGVARSRLQRRNVAFPTISIAAAPEALRVSHERGTDIVFARPDSFVNAKDPEGNPIVVKLSPASILTLQYQAAEGKREDRYVLSADGQRLTLHVKITSPRLPEPLTYRLEYRRR